MAVPIAVVAVVGFVMRWTFDDAYIYFRTVDQLLAGHGPVWNAGERVEAFASPLWLAVLTVGDVLSPFRLEYTAAALALGCTVAALLVGAAASTVLTGAREQVTAVRVPLGLAVFAALWPVWIWSTGGLETGIVLLWLAGCAAVLVRWATSSERRPKLSRVGLVVLGLGWFMGSQYVVFSAVLVATIIFGAPYPGRRRWAMAAWSAAVPIAYQVFRMGYYGMVLSSASVLREDSTPRPGFGWDYVRDFVSPYLLAVPLVAIALTAYVPLVRGLVACGAGRRALVVVALAGSGIAHAAVLVVVMGGDSIHARLLLPALFAVLLPVLVVAAEPRFIQAIIVCSLWAGLCGALLRPEDESASFSRAYPGRQLTLEDAGFGERGVQPWMDGPGFYVADSFAESGTRLSFELSDPDRIVVASSGVDALSYALGPDIDVLDVSGTGDPLTTHHALEFRLVPGAEKAAYGPWVSATYAAHPASVLPGVVPFERLFRDATPPLELLEQVAWAESTLECARVERLLRASTEPLSPGRFVENMWDAMSNTTLRLGAVPEDAFEDVSCSEEDVPEGVVEFWERVDTDGTFAIDDERGTLVVAGRCDVALVATGDSDEPWRAIEARERRATVELDPTSTEPLFAAVFVIGPTGTDSAVVWIATDGAGNVQVIQHVDWFPPVASPWRPIVDGVPNEIAIVPDLSDQSWVTIVDGTVVASVPMLGPGRDGIDKDLIGSPLDGNVVVVTPRTAPPGVTEPAIVHDHYRLSDVCRAIATHHADASTGTTGRIDRIVPSVR